MSAARQVLLQAGWGAGPGSLFPADVWDQMFKDELPHSSAPRPCSLEGPCGCQPLSASAYVGHEQNESHPSACLRG